ncbi:hypothetical protein ACO0LL_07080 [Undibacterium sp. TC4M20W]|uniref:hypothetical protein n=1 Tax=Undibacterium sp. TC4M20W TaxID=3413052 RepID=UPI003BF00707
MIGVRLRTAALGVKQENAAQMLNRQSAPLKTKQAADIMKNSSQARTSTNLVRPADTERAPDLKDPNITPGSILDMDADGRRDTKEMSLHALWHLRHGDAMINGQVAHPTQNCVLALPELLPSTNIPAMPAPVSTPCKDMCAPTPYEDEE